MRTALELAVRCLKENNKQKILLREQLEVMSEGVKLKVAKAMIEAIASEKERKSKKLVTMAAKTLINII